MVHYTSERIEKGQKHKSDRKQKKDKGFKDKQDVCFLKKSQHSVHRSPQQQVALVSSTTGLEEKCRGFLWSLAVNERTAPVTLFQGLAQLINVRIHTPSMLIWHK